MQAVESMSIVPTAAALGAEVRGVDLAERLDDETFRRIDEALSRHGMLFFRGQDITRLGTAARGRLGIGRTFQRMELADSLTVADNVALGSESALAGARLVRQLFAPRAEWRTTQQATREAMTMCGVSHLAGNQAGELSTGERRLVELARCLAGRFDLLLLDEPSSGLDRDETARFGEVLRTVVEQRGCGILLVEHDMSMVMNVCSYIYVLDFGRMLFEGEPAAVAASSIVRDAYLGSEELATTTVVP